MRHIVLGVSAALCLSGCGSSDAERGQPTGPNLGSTPEQGPPPNAVGGFSITIPKETLAPGDETLPCWLFPLELEGPSRFVAAASLSVGDGLHHGNITTRKKTGEGVRPCPKDDNPGIVGGEAGDIIDGGAVLFGSSTQLVGTEWHRFPEGKAYRVKDGYEVVARMHYLNTGGSSISVEPKYRWYTIPEADVVDELAPFAWVLTDFEIPPLAEHSESRDCTFWKEMRVVDAMPHMHALGTRFHASFRGGPRDGELWLDHQGYDENTDILSYDPAVDLSQGEGVSFGCTWKNTFAKPIHEGIGDNEMCILFGYAYPAVNSFSAYAGAGGCVVVLPPAPGSP